MDDKTYFTKQELIDLLQDKSITSHFRQAIQTALANGNPQLIEKVTPQTYALTSPCVS
jgi:hypothetical protein